MTAASAKAGESPVPPKDQVAFLLNIQRLLQEGSFVATYKFALLHALADLAVSLGSEKNGAAPLHLPLPLIGAKFVDYYWRQAAKYPGRPGQEKPGHVPILASVAVSENRYVSRLFQAEVLFQNTDRQAGIVREVFEARERFDGRYGDLRSDARSYRALVAKTTALVTKMPLWKLQTVGGEHAEFLYENHRLVDGGIVLKPGVAYCLRTFHRLITELVRSRWADFVRQLPRNGPAVGKTDLHEFLFGVARADLSAYRPILAEFQKGDCFYCAKSLGAAPAVDHFVPWSRYPFDLGHNLVLAHPACNAAKSDHLAALRHLDRFCTRNATSGPALARAFDTAHLVSDLEVTRKVTQWAYAQAHRSGADVWDAGKRLVSLEAGWGARGWLEQL